MEILAPLNNVNDIEKLVNAGVTELYFGFYDEEWTRQFGENSCINRMSNFGERANSISVRQVSEVVKAIRKAGAKSFITLNATQYTTQELEMLSIYLQSWRNEKPDGIIVSGVDEARLVLEHGLVPVASTMCGIFNADIAKYYADIGVKRMILPREMTLDEMKNICEQCSDVEFEAFFMRNGCMFSDTFCLGVHSREHGSLCANLCNSKTMIQGDRGDFYSVNEAEENCIIFHEYYHRSTCGMCALYRLKEIGISSLKIVGRADHSDAIAEDAKLIYNNIRIVNDVKSEKVYLNKMQFPKNRYYRCKNGLSCYYPEVRF